MFRNVKVASQAPAMLSTPIVQEASSYAPQMAKGQFDELKGMFTIGTAPLTAAIAEEDKKNG